MPRCDKVQSCRSCGCTDNDCRQCIARTGEPCHWVQPDLCSACDESIAINWAVIHLREWAKSLKRGHEEPDGTWHKSNQHVKKQYDAIMNTARTMARILKRLKSYVR